MSPRMHRTQVYLEQDLVDGLQRVARREGTSMGDLIRRGAWQVLNSAPAIEPWSAEDPIWELLGMIKDGEPNDDARHVDEIVYGERHDTSHRVDEILYDELQKPRPARLRIAENKPESK